MNKKLVIKIKKMHVANKNNRKGQNFRYLSENIDLY